MLDNIIKLYVLFTNVRKSRECRYSNLLLPLRSVEKQTINVLCLELKNKHIVKDASQVCCTRAESSISSSQSYLVKYLNRKHTALIEHRAHRILVARDQTTSIDERRRRPLLGKARVVNARRP